VVFLEAFDPVARLLDRADGGDAGAGAAEGGHRGDAGGDGRAADRDLVAARLLAARRVEDEMDLAVFDQAFYFAIRAGSFQTYISAQNHDRKGSVAALLQGADVFIGFLNRWD